MADLVVPVPVRSVSVPKIIGRHLKLPADNYKYNSVSFELHNCRSIVITIGRHLKPSADSYNSNLVHCKFHNYRPTLITIGRQLYLFIYLLYLTLVYKIVKNNSTNKYQSA